MSQPASILSADFAPGAPAVFEAFDTASHHGKAPISHAHAELSLAARGAEIGPKWSPAQTLRFIVLSCGGFWLAAAALYVTIH
jgi:hypothetical protein